MYESFAFHVTLSFLTGPELLSLQRVSRVFYHRIIPRFLIDQDRIINRPDRFGSKILDDTLTILSLKRLLTGHRIGMNLWRGSRDGFGSMVFHNLCNNKGKTLTLIRTKRGGVFGGYTDVPWSSNLQEPYVPSSGYGYFELSSSSYLFLVDG